MVLDEGPGQSIVDYLLSKSSAAFSVHAPLDNPNKENSNEENPPRNNPTRIST